MRTRISNGYESHRVMRHKDSQQARELISARNTVTQTLIQQRLESLKATLAWHASKHKHSDNNNGTLIQRLRTQDLYNQKQYYLHIYTCLSKHTYARTHARTHAQCGGGGMRAKRSNTYMILGKCLNIGSVAHSHTLC